MLVKERLFRKYISKILLESIKSSPPTVTIGNNDYYVISDIDLLNRTIKAFANSTTEHGERFEEAIQLLPGMTALNVGTQFFPFADFYEDTSNMRICYSAKCKQGFMETGQSAHQWIGPLVMAKETLMHGRKCAVGIVQGWLDDSARLETQRIGLAIRVEKFKPTPDAPTITYDNQKKLFTLERATKNLALSYFGNGNPSHQGKLQQDQKNPTTFTFSGEAGDLKAPIYH